MKKEELDRLFSLNLEEKVEKSKEIIVDFYESVDSESVYISSSFGKDSLVLIDLVREIYPNVPIIYINTGLEHKSCVELSKKYENVYEIKPKKTMKKIIDKYGYITPYGKEISGAIEQVRRNLYDGKLNSYRVKQFRGEIGYNYTKFVNDLLAPFKISDKCCYHLKVSPLQSFCNKNGFLYSFMGITAEESSMRRKNLLKYGFNTEKQSRPLGFWTTNDVLSYLVQNEIEIASCYGEIIKKDGVLRTSLHQRNGCVCCPIGSLVESPNKFQLLYQNDRKTWDFVINELNFKEVCDWFNVKYK